MSKAFKPIPKKIHKTQRHERKITSKRQSYTPKPYKLSTIREAKPIPHKRTFFVQKKAPVPKSPYKYKYKTETRLNGVFVALLLLLLALIGGFVALLLYLLKH